MIQNKSIIFLLLIAASSFSIIVELGPANPTTCFYIRGHYSEENFSCQFGASGEAPSELLTTFGEIEGEGNLFESKPRTTTSSDGVISLIMEKNKIYRLCFTSTDAKKKMVAFDYVQTHRKKHYTKRDVKDTHKLLDELSNNQLKLDTRLSFFQSNVFAHTQVLENHKKSIIWSSVAKLGCMILVATLQVNFLLKLMEQTKTKITELI